MTSTLRTLLDRVEKGEGADQELDVLLVAAFFAPPDAYVAIGKVSGDYHIYQGRHRSGQARLWPGSPVAWQHSPTSSIDAAVQKPRAKSFPDILDGSQLGASLQLGGRA